MAHSPASKPATRLYGASSPREASPGHVAAAGNGQAHTRDPRRLLAGAAPRVATVGTPEPLRAPDYLEGVRRSRLIGLLSPDDMAAVLAHSRSRRIAKGTRLFREGDDVAIVLLDGTAKAQALTLDGGSAILTLLGTGATWGLAATFGQPLAGIEVIGVSDVRALVIPGAHLRSLATERPAVAIASLRAVATELAQVREEEARLSFTSTSQRVVQRLVELADRWGEPDPRDERVVYVNLPLTQEELASWSHASRESTAKVLQGLRRSGIVETGRRTITILRFDRLKARAGGPSSDAIVDQLRQAIGTSAMSRAHRLP